MKGLPQAAKTPSARSKPGDRTVIDALQPALDALPDGLGKAALAAREGANATASITRAMETARRRSRE